MIRMTVEQDLETLWDVRANRTALKREAKRIINEED